MIQISNINKNDKYTNGQDVWIVLNIDMRRGILLCAPINMENKINHQRTFPISFAAFIMWATSKI